MVKGGEPDPGWIDIKLTVYPEGWRMFRAIVEVMGAFFASGPVSEKADGRRSRLIAVVLILVAIFACAGITTLT
jgi:hypothetical protein